MVIRGIFTLVLLFVIFQLLYLKLPKTYVFNILKGTGLATAGLILFLLGVYVGFLPVGEAIGETLGTWEHNWLLMPVGFFLGFVTTFSEPAVRILSNQVEESSSGFIRKPLVLYTMSLGVAAFVALGMAKIVYGIPLLYIIIPGYVLALVIMWFSDKTFTAIAFDGGGVATGPMTVIFLTAVSVGIASVMGGKDAMIDGFGLIALIVLAPILSVMLLGLIFRVKYQNSMEAKK